MRSGHNVRQHADAAFLEQETLQELRLIRTEGIGPRTFYQLLKRYGDAKEALVHLPDIKKKFSHARSFKIPPIEEIEKEYTKARKSGVIFLSYKDSSYPFLLKQCDDAPPFLSVKGDLSLILKPFFAIVGARNGSLAGQKLAKQFAHDLGKSGLVIVSGLARGIDTAAHKGGLEAGTVGIVAGGIDQIYPPENGTLYHEMCEKGLVISEMPWGCAPAAPLFPRRNRLISGMAQGILVVEAALKSGSLLTAHYGAEQGRDIFAVPGNPLDPRARGTNSLLKTGAYLVETVEDILSVLKFSPQKEENSSEILRSFPKENQYTKGVEARNLSSEVTARVYEFLNSAPMEINEIAENLDISLALLRASLVEIEIAGYLVRHSGDRVSLLSPVT